MKQNNMTKVHYGGTVRTVGYYFDNRQQPWYVAQVKGEGGVDWGYTFDISKARGLNKYWQKRFRADSEYVGRKATFMSTSS